VKAIAEARIKTDSIDSQTLAYLLRADLIPEAYLRDKSNLQRHSDEDCALLKSRLNFMDLKLKSGLFGFENREKN
jgi:hypothetical protein